MTAFEELQTRVAGDAALQERLQSAEDEETFLQTVEALARELGFDLDRDEIRTGIEASTAAAKGTELSDQDLANVAGGGVLTGAALSYLCFYGGIYTYRWATANCITGT